ncbi:MAG: glycosyltransferase family 39 protein [Ardenticatenaceae bacterium]|nr:glycosyltransferase family 39 protein [Ardenticatenaceae bacterium]HBY99522.1 hypothetical protein [Chloroflexota bacterium]
MAKKQQQPSPPRVTGPLVVAPVNGEEHEPLTSPTPPVTTAAAGPSLESTLWLLLGLMATVVRVGDLARWPLAELEARLALVAGGTPGSGEGVGYLSRGLSPLLLNATALLFRLFGETDGWARAISALAGIATVVSFWLLRPIVGRGTALGAALLVLFSPALLFFSRQAQPEALSVFFSLLLVAGVARFVRSRQRGDAWLMTIALALGLTSGPGFWSVLVAGTLFVGWLRYSGRRGDKESRNEEAREELSVSGRDGDVRSIWSDLRPLAGRLTFEGLALFVLVATAGGTNPAGLGAAFDLPAQWLGAIFGRGPALPVPFMLAVLLYELPIVILGIAGAAVWVERQPGWVIFLLIWTAVTMVPATLFNSGWAGGVAVVALPLALLGGAGLARIAGAVQREGRWEAEGAYLALVAIIGGFLWLNIIAYLQTAQSLHLWLAFAALLVLVSGLSMIWSLSGGGGVLRALGLTAALLLPVVSLRTAWMLSFMYGNDPREPLVAAGTPSDPDLRTLAHFLAETSNERLHERNSLPVALQRSLGAAPYWYLRDFRHLTLVEGGSADVPTAALLSPDQPAPPGMIGSRYTVRPSWQWPGLTGQPLLRWLVMRDVQSGLGAQEAILYVQVPEGK